MTVRNFWQALVERKLGIPAGTLGNRILSGLGNVVARGVGVIAAVELGVDVVRLSGDLVGAVNDLHTEQARSRELDIAAGVLRSRTEIIMPEVWHRDP